MIELEKILVEKLKAHLSVAFNTDSHFTEINAGYGIADLVFAPNFNFKRSLRSDRMPLTDLRAIRLILNLDRRKHYELSSLYALFPNLSKEEIRRSLRNLTEAGLISKISKKTFKPLSKKDQLSPIPEIIAIEAKLKDHKGGFMQALRYQYFADKVFLAIIKDAIDQSTIKEYREKAVGVILYDESTDKVEIYQPLRKANRRQPNMSFFAREILFKQYLEQH